MGENDRGRRTRWQLRVCLGEVENRREVVRWFAHDFMRAVLPSLRRAPVDVSVELVRPEDQDV